MVYVLILIIMAVLYLLIGTYAYFENKAGLSNRILLVLTFLFSGWAFSGALYQADSQVTITSAWLFYSYVVWTIGTAMILHFCISIINQDKKIASTALGLIYIPSLLMLIGMLMTKGFLIENQYRGDGIYLIFGIPGGILFYLIYTALSIIKLVNYRKGTHLLRIKKQSRLISIALVVSTILIAFYGFVLPPLLNSSMPVLLPIIPGIWIYSMWLSVTKYGFLKINMELASIELMDNIQEIVLLTDLNGKIIDVNRRFEELLKRCKETVIGQPLDLILFDHPDIILNLEKISREEIDGFIGEIEFRIDERYRIPLRLSLSAVRDYYSRIVGVIIACNDLSIEKKFEQQSVTDALTNTYNRLKLDRILSRLFVSKEPFVVLMCDIDNFKHVNDTYGHPTGDRILVTVVKLINEEIRATDFLGRWGGEEFLVILPMSSLTNAYDIAERIRIRISTYDFGLTFPVSVSIGAADSVGKSSVETIVQDSDICLYEAKKEGKNKVVLHENYEGIDL